MNTQEKVKKVPVRDNHSLAEAFIKLNKDNNPADWSPEWIEGWECGVLDFAHFGIEERGEDTDNKEDENLNQHE